MEKVISVITGWKDLITEVFGTYPLAGALVTLLAVGVFWLLHRQYRKGKVATNIFLVLLGWAIAVPIVGFILDIAAEIYGAIKKVLGFLWSVLASLYEIYLKHPLFVIFLMVVSVAVYFLWAWLRPKLIPGKPLRVILLFMAAVAIAHLASPLLDLFAGPKEPSPAHITNSTSSQSSSLARSSPMQIDHSSSLIASTISTSSPAISSAPIASSANSSSPKPTP